VSRFAEQFLQQPDLFPGRAAGEAWGEQETGLDLTGGPYRVSGLSRPQAEAVEVRFPLRSCAPSTAAVEIQVFRIDAKTFRDFSLAGWTYTIDFEHQPGRVLLAGLGFVGILQLAETETGVMQLQSAALWTPEEAAFATSGVLENFLRVVVSYRLLGMGGVMLHSAAVARNGKAHVFVGHSGAGKSTLSRISHEAGFQVLSDDVNTLVAPSRGDGAQIMVEQIPFAGDFGHEMLVRGSFPLAGLYRLEQSPSHRLEPLSLGDTVGLLLANSPFVNCDRHRLDQLLQVLLSLAGSAAAHRLGFSRDRGFWDLLMP